MTLTFNRSGAARAGGSAGWVQGAGGDGPGRNGQGDADCGPGPSQDRNNTGWAITDVILICLYENNQLNI